MKKVSVTQGLYLFASFVVLMACAKAPQSTGQGLASSEAGIIGGSDVSSADALSTSIVAIYEKTKGALCTGSILSDELILTAAHCALDSDPKSMVVLFGLSAQQSTGRQIRQVIDGVVHPAYKALMTKLKSHPEIDFGTVQNQQDLAVLKFSGGLPSG